MRRYRECPVVPDSRHYWIVLLSQSMEMRRGDPGLLNELELTLDISIDADEAQPARNRVPIGLPLDIGAANAEYAVAV